MKTRFSRYKGVIALIIDEPGPRGVLAQMTMDEGTGCWSLIDIRLTQYRSISEYSCSGAADDFCANFIPENEKEAAYLKSVLREYTILEDEDPLYNGMYLWCTFDGIVRGKTHVNGYAPACWKNFNQAGWFSRAEGLAKLKEIQSFWDSYNGDPRKTPVRIHNPLRQPSEGFIMAKIFSARYDEEKKK